MPDRDKEMAMLEEAAKNVPVFNLPTNFNFTENVGHSSTGDFFNWHLFPDAAYRTRCHGCQRVLHQITSTLDIWSTTCPGKHHFYLKSCAFTCCFINILSWYTV